MYSILYDLLRNSRFDLRVSYMFVAVVCCRCAARVYLLVFDVYFLLSTVTVVGIAMRNQRSCSFSGYISYVEWSKSDQQVAQKELVLKI